VTRASGGDDAGAEGAPPRLATRLLRRMLPPGVRGDTIAGDLIEEWRARRNAPGARVWYWRHALSLAVRYAWRRDRCADPAAAGTRRFDMFLDNLAQDLRYTIRSYAKTPSFSIAILATLALGIGASTAIFSMVNGILLRPLPLPDSDRLVYANELNRSGTQISVSWPNFVDWRSRAHSFQGLASSREEPLTLTGLVQPERVRARRTTANFFQIVGVQPRLGRSFADADDRSGEEPTVILSHEFWQTRLGGDASVLGTRLSLDARAYTIVGVMPPGFRYLRAYDLFIPMGSIAGDRSLNDRGNHQGYSIVGRLKPGVAVETAARELTGIGLDLQREHPDTNSGVTVQLEPLAARLVAQVRLTLLVLLGAVGCLLLVACVNVANLLIARGAARQHELAVRAALGGGRSRLAMQMLAESTLVSAAGGALGIALASWLLRLLMAVAPEGTPRLDEVAVDARACLFALSAAAVCGIVFGAFPAFQASGARGQAALTRGRTAGASASSHRVRRALMVVEVALALVLLTGAGLMMRTLGQLTHVDTGFRSDHLLTMRFSLSGERYDEPHRLRFFDDLLTNLRGLPGVAGAALAFSLPIEGSNWNSAFIARDKPIPPRPELPSGAYSPVSDGYFETMGTRLVAGRLFDRRDAAGAPNVVIVNERLATRIWPGESAVGKSVKQGWPESPGTWREVVGVVADVKFEGLAAETPMQVYLPLAQETARGLALIVRTPGEPAVMNAAVEAAVHRIDKDLPLYAARTMDQVLDTSMARERMSMSILVVFAAIALVLASVGLYGVVAHAVTERTHEIGVRMALGAEPRHVLGLVVRQGLSMALIGTVLGIAGAVALSRSIQGLLFGVQAIDPLTFGTVAIVLLGVALIACCIPAVRATRLNPTAALRAD
jgi:putative ABC transport system permease protein